MKGAPPQELPRNCCCLLCLLNELQVQVLGLLFEPFYALFPEFLFVVLYAFVNVLLVRI